MGRRLGIFGGTFDPIHTGHLALALQVTSALSLTQMRLMPTHLPPHRGNPTASAQQRAAMVQLAIADYAMLSLDKRELVRHSTSYTIDSLREIRREEADEAALFFVMGMDSLCALHTWREWQQLTDYANLVVVARPGQNWPDADTDVGVWLQGRVFSAHDSWAGSCGGVVRLDADFPQSATAIRKALQSGEKEHEWLQPKVAAYINQRALYRHR